MRTFGQRIKGAMLLDVAVYEEVEADASANFQAMGVVVLSSLAAGVGFGLPYGILGLVNATIQALIGWLLWAGLTHLIGSRILETQRTVSSWGQLLRTTGFSTAPGLLRILFIVPVINRIPVLGYLFLLAIFVWILVAFVIAVRQALDYESTWRAVAVCLTALLFIAIPYLTVRFAI